MTTIVITTVHHRPFLPRTTTTPLHHPTTITTHLIPPLFN
jgi:hypothetical protein